MDDKRTYYFTNGSADTRPDALRVNPFTVPDDYFENLERTTRQRCLHVDASQAFFEVPAGYFEQLETRIAVRIAEQKLKSKLQDTGFSVPEGYFTSLADRISSGIDVPVRKLTTPKKWIRYAAACIALLMSCITALTLINRDEGTPPVSASLASVPAQEIVNYLEVYGTQNDMVFITEYLTDFNEQRIGEGSSEEDIEVYLNHML